MTNSPAAICRIYRNNFKRHYLTNRRLSLDFLLHLGNVPEIGRIFKKKDEYPGLIISEIIDAERSGYLKL